ncbi:unnamed protein product, partial [Staurois parvus]
MQSPGESRYSECRVRRESNYSECRVQGEPDIVNAGSGESGPNIVNEGSGRADIVNAGSRGERYSECRVR